MPPSNRTMIQILLYYEKNAKDEVKFLCHKAIERLKKNFIEQGGF